MKKKFNLFLEEKGISKADFLGKAVSEQGELHNEFQESQFKGLEDLIAKKLDSSEIESLKKDGTLTSEIKAEVVRLSEEFKSLKEVAPVAQFKSVEQDLAEQLSLKKSEIDSIKDGDSKKIVLSVKAAATLTTGNVTAVGTGGLSMLLNQFEGGISPLPRSAPFFADLFASAPTSGNTISYAEMKNPDGGAGMTGEGSAKTQADFDLVEAKTNVRKITSYIKTSKEALDDIPALAGEINNELVTLIKLKKDSEVLSGAGTGNTLSGVLTNATAFTGGALALSVVTPNNYDVLVAGITQIATAEVVSGQPAGFMANVIVMNPSDVALMKLTKDANKNYIFPVTLPSSTSVMEVPVISNARMTAGDFLIMDTSKGNLRIKEDITLSVGYENDDFTKNLVTILAEMRLAFYIKSQHLKAFVKGTFSTAITAITKS